MEKSKRELLQVVLAGVMMFVLFALAIIVPREITKMDSDMIHVDKRGTIYGKIVESNEDVEALKKEWPRGVTIFHMSRNVCAESPNGASCWTSDEVVIDTVEKRVWLGGQYMPYVRVK